MKFQWLGKRFILSYTRTKFSPPPENFAKEYLLSFPEKKPPHAAVCQASGNTWLKSQKKIYPLLLYL
jgi:hypothetical protein